MPAISIIKAIPLLFVFIPVATLALTSQSGEIFKVLKQKDQELFADAYNSCNSKILDNLLSKDFEFYHDRKGINKSRYEFIESFRNKQCQLRQTDFRTLDESSLQVFPLYRDGDIYGALQTGTHRFGNTRARFSHLWLLENSQWMLARVISYDHQRPVQIVSEQSQQDITFISLNTAERAVYHGAYIFSEDFKLVILEQNETLYGEADGNKIPIKPFSKNRFLDENQSTELRFILDAQGMATELHLIRKDDTLIGKKSFN